MTSRIEVLADIFADIRSYRDYSSLTASSSSSSSSSSGHHHFVASAPPKLQVSHAAICADFNTLAHGIARFSPKYCKDSLRWKSIGWTESEWWGHYILNQWEGVDGKMNQK